MNPMIDLNVVPFESLMSFEINPHKSIFLFTFLKLDERKDWGTFRFDKIVKVRKEDPKSMLK